LNHTTSNGSHTYDTAQPRERALLVGVDLRRAAEPWPVEQSLAELAQLAETAGAEVVGTAVQRLDVPHAATYLGKGKVQELAAQREELGATLVIVDAELSPTQQRNLENAFAVKLLDRTALILDIFAQRARTHEGGLQVELAQLQYLLPRLAGQWSHLERLGGGIGTRGPGETQIESDRRLVRARIDHLRKVLEEVRGQRAQQRRRRSQQRLPVVALVGYTNAGKSTLLNALTGADVPAEDRLFATLDPTTRRLRLPDGQEVLVSDTVGFIHRLPPMLVAAFRATLEELREADLLLHVIDITSRYAREQAETVDRVLGDLGLSKTPRLLVLNKADGLEGWPGIGSFQPPQWAEEGVLIAATHRWGMDRLLEALAKSLTEAWPELTWRLPYTEAHLLPLLHRQGRVTSERYVRNAIVLRGRMPPAVAATLSPYRTRRSTIAT